MVSLHALRGGAISRQCSLLRRSLNTHGCLHWLATSQYCSKLVHGFFYNEYTTLVAYNSSELVCIGKCARSLYSKESSAKCSRQQLLKYSDYFETCMWFVGIIRSPCIVLHSTSSLSVQLTSHSGPQCPWMPKHSAQAGESDHQAKESGGVILHQSQQTVDMYIVAFLTYVRSFEEFALLNDSYPHLEHDIWENWYLTPKRWQLYG